MLKLIMVLVGLCFVSNLLSISSMTIVLTLLAISWIGKGNVTFSSISYFSVDSLSWFLILLTLWIILLMLISSNGYFAGGFYSKNVVGYCV